MQVGFSSLGKNLIVKIFLYFSSLYSNLVFEARIFAVSDYYELLPISEL
jgi:hypothetical protein